MWYACINQESHVVSNNYICVHMLLVSDSGSKVRVEWTVLSLFPSGPGDLRWTGVSPLPLLLWIITSALILRFDMSIKVANLLYVSY